MKKAFSILIILLVSFPLMCLVIEQEGWGATVSEARTEAAAELSKYLYSSVDSTTTTTVSDSQRGLEESFYKGTEIRSQLPLLGVSYSERKESGSYVSTARMDSSVSLPMYYSELNSVVSRLEKMPDLKGIGTIKAAEILNGMLDDYEEYKKLKYIVVALNGNFFRSPGITENEIRDALVRVNGTIDSFEKAALVLTQGCTYSGIYVEQPLPSADNVASDFSIIFGDAIRSVLGGKTVSDLQKGKYFFSARYSEDQNGNLFMVADLNDSEGRSVFSSSVTIPAELVKGIAIYADGYDFRKAMSTGESVTNGFNVYIRINGGSSKSTFHGGDELYLEVKSSKPCYFYVVGYVFNDKGSKFSYLFPLSLSEEGKDMFVGKISTENVGKWVVINPSYAGEVFPIEIIEPYGIETLQVYASTTGDYNEFLSKIPEWTETEEFYIVSGEPEKALSTTRALNVKKATSAQKKSETAEANVTYRSIK